MAVQPTWITGIQGGAAGPQSAKVTYPAGASLADLMDTVESVILARGVTAWNLASAGTNRRAYRQANLPDRLGVVGYHYTVLDWNTAGSVLMNQYLTFSSSSDSGTGLVANSNVVANNQRVDLTNGGSLEIYVSQHHFLMLSRILAGIGSSTGNSFCGSVELTREGPNNIIGAGYSTRVWVDTVTSQAAGINAPVVFPNSNRGGGATTVMTDFGTGGLIVGVSNPPINAYPNGLDIETGLEFVSGIRITFHGATSYCDFGRCLRFWAGTRSQGITSTEYSIPLSPDANYGGELFMDRVNGTLTQVWRLQSNTSRFFVPK